MNCSSKDINKDVLKKNIHIQNPKKYLVFLIITFLSFTTSYRSYAQDVWEEQYLPNPRHIQALEITPTGILAGEFDTRIYLNPSPYNGIYFSKDFGQSWDKVGLEGRGILDMKYFDGSVYAATYYVISGTNGLFYSNDMGNTWENIGPALSPTKIDRDSKTIYLGTEHYGLYISKDEGETWVKKIPEAGTSWKVYEVQSSEDITLISKNDRVYKSNDNGESWQVVSDLDNKSINSFSINHNYVFAGSSGSYGLFLSEDLGETWKWVSGFGNFAVGKIYFFDNKYFAGKYNPAKDLYTIYYSSDNGDTWVDTNLDTPKNDAVVSITHLFSEPKYLFASIINQGVFKYVIPSPTIPKNKFLDIPWNYSKSSELLDNITSYFDHSYPLLGYSQYSEPDPETNTTTNFLGNKNIIPFIYYSGHSGIDFGLKYGTQIKAPASGYASYYYCKDCGNSIKIDHQNGYQTTYMHLQDDGIITKDTQVFVNKNDIIGQVGLTGRTTGPHLHFEVLKDVNTNGSYIDDFPSGRVDPFGWQSNNRMDPWEHFIWTDTLGDHAGTKSLYLWGEENSSYSKVISSYSAADETSLYTDNKWVSFGKTIQNFTATITTYVKPVLDDSEKYIDYIKNSSFVLNAYDQVGNEIKNFSNFITINIDIDPQDLINIDPDTLVLKFYDEENNKWISLESFFDQTLSRVTATTNHLSWFSVFGNKIDVTPPSTDILVSGTEIDGWFVYPPTIEIINTETASDLEYIVYSTNNGDSWDSYNQSFLLTSDGITNILYKSIDSNGNIENEKSYVITANFTNSPTKKLKIENAGFNISD